MAEAPSLGLAMGLPPARALDYFRSKGYEIGWNWQDVWQDAQTRAFTVAKAMRLDILHDIRSELTRALEQGRTLRDFQRDLEPRLRARGWWGRQVIVDSEGQAQRVELGSPRRLATIYRTNMQTAFMAGRYQELAENTRLRPYWQYIAVLDERTRPAHRALHQRVFRHDDPFWEVFFPPNGFNCRCRVRALSQRELDRYGLQVSESGRYLGERWAVDQRSGFTAPVGTYRAPDMDRTVSPDLGWSYNPGRAWSRWDAAGARPDAPSGGGNGPAGGAAPADALPSAPHQYTWRDYRRPDIREIPDRLRRPAPPEVPEAPTSAAARDVLAAEFEVSPDTPSRTIETPVEPVTIRYDWLDHLVEKRRDARERYARFVLETLRDPFEVWLTRYADGYRKRYVGLFSGATDLAVIVRENRDGSLLWNVLQRDDRRMNALREGALLYGKE